MRVWCFSPQQTAFILQGMRGSHWLHILPGPVYSRPSPRSHAIKAELHITGGGEQLHPKMSGGLVTPSNPPRGNANSQQFRLGQSFCKRGCSSTPQDDGYLMQRTVTQTHPDQENPQHFPQLLKTSSPSNSVFLFVSFVCCCCCCVCVFCDALWMFILLVNQCY